MFTTKTTKLSVSRNRAGSFFVFLFLCFIVSRPCLAQDEASLTDAASQGKGGSSVATPSVWSSFSNQGALGYYSQKAIAIHQENRFIIKELNVNGLSLSIPTKPGTIGVAFSRYGYRLYNETKGILSFGRKLWPSFSAGVGIAIHRLHVGEGNGNATATTVEAGILYSPIPDLAVGVHAFNPTMEKIGHTPQKNLSSGITAGVDYRLPQGVLTSISATQRNSYKTEVNLGIEAKLVEMLMLRAGYSSQPNKLSFGFGYEYRTFTIDLAITTNNPLGISGYISAAYHIQ